MEIIDYKHGKLEVPADWTAAQWESAKRTCERFEVKFDPKEWDIYHLDGYIGKSFPSALGGNIFIGIEKDGYAHS
jgi:hypothetical protein